MSVIDQWRKAVEAARAEHRRAALALERADQRFDDAREAFHQAECLLGEAQDEEFQAAEDLQAAEEALREVEEAEDTAPPSHPGQRALWGDS